FAPKAISATGIGRLNIGNGTVTAANIRLNKGNWQAVVNPQNVRLGSLVAVPPQFKQGRLMGIFNASGTTESFAPNAISATGIGRLKVADGTVTATNIQLNRGNWQALVQAQEVQLQQIVPTNVPPQFRGRASGVFQASGTTESFELNAISATGRGQLNAASGRIVATDIQLNKGNFQALVNPNQLQLSQFSPDLRGNLDGQLQVNGNVAAFNLAGVRANGQVILSQGVSLVTQPLTAEIKWDGRKVTVLKATSADTIASGVIFVNPQIPAIESLNLQVQAKNYALQDLPFSLPNAVSLAGKGDFAGRISGTLPTPNVVGAVRLRDLVVNKLAFERVLTGNVQVTTSSGVELDVKGNNDRIALNLDPNYLPNSFTVQRDRAIASGETSGENLLVKVENFPLLALSLRLPNTALGSQPIGGLLTGDFTVNKQTIAVAGDVAISQPVLGRLKGEEFTGQFTYNKGAVSLTDARFKIGESIYAATGSFAPNGSGAPQIKGQLKVTNGKVTDAIAAFQLISLQNSDGVLPTTRGANSLRALPVGLPSATLLAQLRRYSEINMLLQIQQQERRSNSPQIPKLEDLEGIFNADIAVNGTVPNGLSVKFDIDGTDWKLGNYYTANQVKAEGSLNGGVLTFAPLRLQSAQSLVAFSGQIGGTRQVGQLQINNFPIETLNSFVRLPVDITGNLNAQATLTGQLSNPQVIGKLSLANGTLNQKEINNATSSFSYDNARLNFDSTIKVDSPQPVTISGNVPLALPFVTVKPNSDRITLDINVQDEGLALLNLFTNQVAWQNGQGKVQLQVRGTLKQPVATGVATINNATITAQALPEPLTNVRGTVDFDFDRLQVDNLQGNFSQGQVVVKGVLPIFKSLPPNDPDLANPLTFNLDQLLLNLKGLYRGGASGNVVVSGAANSPVIGGEVLLADGQVLLGENQDAAATSSRQQIANSLRPSTVSPVSTSPAFNNLLLTLGDNIAIARQPILQFQAGGTLTINGSLDDIRPQGNIRLRSGGVNLFTTQFVLARGYENQATFIPDRGLDPDLDVRLVARVPEVTASSRVPSSPISSEISEALATDLGSLRTVRVQARVLGPASQLFDNLELTSDPSRSQNEIVSLIGGGFVDTLGRGDSTLGLANLAGSAILGNFQGTFSRIGNAFGLDELRLFPTVTTSEESRNSTLGLAAEGNIDLSRNLSVSVLKILTTNDPTQFGLSYRLSDRVRIRASSNLNAESLAIFEYQNS
ncbi:MAG: translocation/assembly module TamB domain-containing protein, partial [Tatlockia sp.]|nr:translocation/assembly module TamB domain-containing protein [Tatlockia sp.]